MKLFLRKVLQFLILPVIIFIGLLAGYIIYDPFKVVKSYDDYSHSFNINRGYISSEVFLRNYRKQQYNSFIFGSSRIFGFHVSSWKSHLKADANVYSFDAYGEKISGMYHKLKFLDEKGIDIKNALLCFDTDYTFRKQENQPKYLYIEHPALSDISWIEFHEVTFETYLNPSFLYSLYAKEVFGINNEYVNRHYSKDGGITYDTITNEPRREDLDSKIEKDFSGYYSQVYFYSVTETGEPPYPIIDDKATKYMRQIKEILDKHHTDYRIILNPLYSQAIFHRIDMETIKKVFGSDRIYNFTGSNNITKNKYNYYEESHFRPFIGDSIMNIIYGDK